MYVTTYCNPPPPPNTNGGGGIGEWLEDSKFGFAEGVGKFPKYLAEPLVEGMKNN